MKHTTNKIEQAFAAFKTENARLDSLAETEDFGHPFTICTNIAKWLKENYFPNGEIRGYFTEENPTATLGKDEGGHDFLVVDGFIIDFWPYAVGYNSPEFVSITDKLVSELYGDPQLWKVVS